MTDNEFIILFLQSSDEEKAMVREILESNQQGSCHED